MTYKYVRPAWCKAKSERDTEICFLLTQLHDLSVKSDKISLLDVGFAGAGYIEKILDFGNIDFTGLDCNAERISGKFLRIPSLSKFGYSRKRWKEVIQRIKYIKADVINYTPSTLYDIVIAISTVEHIISAEYSPGIVSEPYRDIRAVNFMKKLVKENGYLLLTFPCGVEHTLKSRFDLLIYDKDRIDKIIGDWKLIKEQYWMNDGEGFEKCRKDVVLSAVYTVSDYDIKSLCALLLKRE